jgi:hypothetical protein
MLDNAVLTMAMVVSFQMGMAYHFLGLSRHPILIIRTGILVLVFILGLSLPAYVSASALIGSFIAAGPYKKEE